MKLALALETERVEPGEEVAGRIEVVEGGASRSLTVTLSFHEWTRDYSAIPFRSGSIVFEGDLAAGQKIDFDFTMPAGAPPSAKCEHSELYWELDVASDEPGPDSLVRRRLQVG